MFGSSERFLGKLTFRVITFGSAARFSSKPLLAAFVFGSSVTLTEWFVFIAHASNFVLQLSGCCVL